MKYHCIIIGGGLAGLTCGIRCAGAGLRTAVITNGASALHAASGSIDLLRTEGDKSGSGNIFGHIKKFTQERPEHPYNRVGVKRIREAIGFIRNELESAGIILNGLEKKNHLHLTALGNVKQTYLSQRSLFSKGLYRTFTEPGEAAVINFEEFRDFFPLLAEKNFRENPLLKNKKLVFKTLKLSGYTEGKKDITEFRSIDLARVFDTEKYLPRLAADIKNLGGDADIVILPDFIGIDNYSRIHSRLEELTGKYIVEVPNLPPSIPGMRLERGLRSILARYGGELTPGKVTGGLIKDGNLQYINTDATPGYRYISDYYLLATGSFFSGGLSAGFRNISEPVFGLKVTEGGKKKSRYGSRFLGSQGHPFMEFGVETDRKLNPSVAGSGQVKNLFCAGAVLSGYDPVRECSGGGVAISTGYYAAEQIIKGCKRKN